MHQVNARHGYCVLIYFRFELLGLLGVLIYVVNQIFNQLTSNQLVGGSSRPGSALELIQGFLRKNLAKDRGIFYILEDFIRR